MAELYRYLRQLDIPRFLAVAFVVDAVITASLPEARLAAINKLEDKGLR